MGRVRGGGGGYAHTQGRDVAACQNLRAVAKFESMEPHLKDGMGWEGVVGYGVVRGWAWALRCMLLHDT